MWRCNLSKASRLQRRPNDANDTRRMSAHVLRVLTSGWGGMAGAAGAGLVVVWGVAGGEVEAPVAALAVAVCRFGRLLASLSRPLALSGRFAPSSAFVC